LGCVRLVSQCVDLVGDIKHLVCRFRFNDDVVVAVLVAVDAPSACPLVPGGHIIQADKEESIGFAASLRQYAYNAQVDRLFNFHSIHRPLAHYQPQGLSQQLGLFRGILPGAKLWIIKILGNPAANHCRAVVQLGGAFLEGKFKHIQVVYIHAHHRAPVFQFAVLEDCLGLQVIARNDLPDARNGFNFLNCLGGEQFCLGIYSTSAAPAAAHFLFVIHLAVIGVHLNPGKVGDAVELAGGGTLQADGKRNQDDDGCRADYHANGGEGNAPLAPPQVVEHQADQVKKMHAFRLLSLGNDGDDFLFFRYHF